jgi:hypothetical protein
MKDDIRYSEFLFLSALERRDPKFEYIFINGPEQQNMLGLNQIFYMEMTVVLAEPSTFDWATSGRNFVQFSPPYSYARL